MNTPPGPLPAGQTRPALVAECTRVLGCLRTGDTVLLACSGGPDSTALAHLVAEARPDLDLRLVHVRHGLRDDRHDVDVVTTHARWLGLPLSVRDVEVVRDGHGTEAAARDARYAALHDAARTWGASAVLVGHTADDQAETVMLRLTRGTGIDGLAAMEQVSGPLIRPLLRLRRADVHRFVDLEGLPVAEDPTNRDPRVRRAIVRHELLPMLARVAPDPVAALARLADLARDDAAALDHAAVDGVAEVVRVGPVRAISDAALARLAQEAGGGASLARRVVRAVLTELTGQPPDAATVSRVLALPVGSAASLPGPIEVTSAGGWRAFAPRTLPRSDPQPVAATGPTPWAPAGAALAMMLPGHLAVAEGPAGSAESGTRGGDTVQIPFALPGVWAPPPPDREPPVCPPGARPGRLVLALPDGVGELRVRHREPGDRVRTAGGTRALQDVLVDSGVPRAVREIWPVVVARDGRVIWSPGYAADEEVLRAGRRIPARQMRLVAAGGSPVEFT